MARDGRDSASTTPYRSVASYRSRRPRGGSALESSGALAVSRFAPPAGRFAPPPRVRSSGRSIAYSVLTVRTLTLFFLLFSNLQVWGNLNEFSNRSLLYFMRRLETRPTLDSAPFPAPLNWRRIAGPSTHHILPASLVLGLR